jgi:hypothetical protein
VKTIEELELEIAELRGRLAAADTRSSDRPVSRHDLNEFERDLDGRLRRSEEITGTFNLRALQLAAEAVAIAKNPKPVSVRPGAVLVQIFQIGGKLGGALVSRVVEHWTIHLLALVGATAGGAFFGWLAHMLKWVK